MASFFNTALNFLLPPRCLMCRDTIDESGSLCAPCWGSLTFLTKARCHRCGIPFDIQESTVEEAPPLSCGACLASPPPFQSALAALLYDEHSKDLILRFKHGDAIHMAPAFGVWLARAGAEILQRTDALVPVPLHWKRLVKRQYNQAALLVNALEKASGVPALLEGLERTEHTPTQGRLTKEERHKNVAGKFVVPAKSSGAVNKKVITLVDDVYTSGATVAACAKALTKAGAKEVNILTLARVAPL